MRVYSSPVRELIKIRCSPNCVEIGPCTTPTLSLKQTSSKFFTIIPGPNSPNDPPSLADGHPLHSLAAAANFSGSSPISSFISVSFTFAASSSNWLGRNRICEAETFFPQLLYIELTVSQITFCCVGTRTEETEGANADVLTIRRADKRASRKRFMV